MLSGGAVYINVDIFPNITSKDVIVVLVTSMYFKLKKMNEVVCRHVQFDSGFDVMTVNKIA